MLGFNLDALHEEAVKKGLLPKRQDLGTGLPDVISPLTSILPLPTGSNTSSTPTTSPSSADTPASSTAAPTSSAPQTTPTGAPPTPDTISLTTSNPPVDAPTPSVSTPSSSPPPTARPTAPTSTSADNTTSAIVVVGGATINRSTLTKPTVVSSPLVAVSTEPVVFVTDYTSDGRVQRTTATSNRLHTSTTGYSAETIQPALAGGRQGGSGNGGLSEGSKKIIGGVVGGVGGAIFIGAVVILFVRLWVKKKREQRFYAQGGFDDSATTGSNGRSKSPFNRYSSPTPNAPVTAASNF